ncbi:hypothetical protein TIFTF001_018853 [Ficus carica]|uniref:Bulb-type lectin domain-containing protein n=1 Tax=Ficus carica TaxID=3494 RepID=A0AA88DC27_FICCA|nr:hypothetical protein TIFTF001_018853 [Ficus carica]
MGFLAAVCLVVLVKSFFLIFVVDAETITNQSNANIIRLGSSLSPNNTTTPYWLSPSGIFAFGFYPQGGIDNSFSIRIWMLTLPKNVTVWTASIDGSPLLPSTATLELTRLGLLLRTRDDLQRRIVSTFDEEDGALTCAGMFDSGNFVLFGNESNVIWDSFDSPTDTILGGQNLRRGQELVSTGLGYRLSWRNDGTLVLYAPNSFSRPENAYWDSGIPHKEKLFLNNTGVLSIYSRIGNFSQRREFSKLSILANGTASGYNPSKSRDTAIVYRATLDADGIFRLYSHHILSNKSSSVFTRWSNLQNQCDVKGFCGLNSYCVREGGNAVCVCYPGFVFINASTKSRGCYQNFSEESCRPSKEGLLGLRYNISTLKNLWWDDHPFSITPMLDTELCKNSCLEESSCWATLYSSPNSSKYRLPLRYGKVSPNKTSTAFFKLVLGKINDTKHDISSPPENQPAIILMTRTI